MSEQAIETARKKKQDKGNIAEKKEQRILESC